MQNIFKSVYRNFVQRPATSLINLAWLPALGIVLLKVSWSRLGRELAATGNPVEALRYE